MNPGNSAMNTYMLTQFDVLTALHREHYRTRGQIDQRFATAIFNSYCKAKLQKGRTKQEVSWKLADLEAQLPNLAQSFIDTRRTLGLPEGMYRLSRSNTTHGSSSNSNSGSGSSSRPATQWDASDLNRAGMLGWRRNTTTSHTPTPGGFTTASGGSFYSSAHTNIPQTRRPGGPTEVIPGLRYYSSGRTVATGDGNGAGTSSSSATRASGNAVTRPSTSGATSVATGGEEGEDLPPPPYAREDPEPDQTRQLEIRLAGEQSRGQVDLPEVVPAAGLGGTDADADEERDGINGGGGGFALGTPVGTGGLTASGQRGDGGSITPQQREERDLEEAIRLSLAADAARTESSDDQADSNAGSSHQLGTGGALPPAPSSVPSAFITPADNTSSVLNFNGQPAPPSRPPSGPFAHRRATSDFPPMRAGSTSSQSTIGGGGSHAQAHDLMDSTTEDMRQMSMPGEWNRQGSSLAPMIPVQTGGSGRNPFLQDDLSTSGSFSQTPPLPLQRQDTASKNPFLQPRRTSMVGTPTAGSSNNPFAISGSPQAATSGTSHTTYFPPAGGSFVQPQATDMGASKRDSGGFPQTPIAPPSPSPSYPVSSTPFGAPTLPTRKAYAPPPGAPPGHAQSGPPASPLRSTSITSSSSNPHAEHLTRKISSSSHHASGEDPLSILARYDTVILVDDSGSMAGGRWRETRAALMDVAELARRYDQDGVDVMFLNSHVKGMGLTTAEDIERIFASVKPGGSTPLGLAIEGILLDYMSQLESAQALAGRGELPRGENVKPMNLIVITDGAPTDDPESVLVNVARRLDRGNFSMSQVGVQLLQIGNEPEAREFLQELDDHLGDKHGVRDFIDTVPYHGEAMSADLIVKTLLGAINRRIDRR